MESVYVKRAEQFRHLWGLTEAPNYASGAWADLRTWNINHDHPVLSHDFPQKAEQYLLKLCRNRLGLALAPKHANLDALFDWLHTYSVDRSPDWMLEVVHETAPKHFERLVKDFFVNLRSIYAAGRRSVEMPHEFWPWFAATLDSISRTRRLAPHVDVANHVSLAPSSPKSPATHRVVISPGVPHTPTHHATTLKVLTYNICWDCMKGEKKHGSTAYALASRCSQHGRDQHTTPCLRQVATNIEHILRTNSGVDLVGLQEASRYYQIRELSPLLAAMKQYHNTINHEEIVLYVGPKYNVEWHGYGNVSKRPLQVFRLKHHQRGNFVVVVHLHNNHDAKGTPHQIQIGIKNVVNINHELSKVPANASVVCLGDWNDPRQTIPGFQPFLYCNIHLNKTAVTADPPYPKSCCITGLPNDKHMLGVADYVLSNYPTKNALALHQDMLNTQGDASDHYPVIAEVHVP